MNIPKGSTVSSKTQGVTGTVVKEDEESIRIDWRGDGWPHQRYALTHPRYRVEDAIEEERWTLTLPEGYDVYPEWRGTEWEEEDTIVCDCGEAIHNFGWHVDGCPAKPEEE